MICNIASIVSPVILFFPDGEKKQYDNGKAAAQEEEFVIESIYPEGGTIVLKGHYAENRDWIKEQIERTGVEPNLFDGV